MIVLVKRIYDEKANETGAVIQARTERFLGIQKKSQIENELIQYGFEELYPGDELSVFRNIHSESPSVTVLKNVERLNYDMKDI